MWSISVKANGEPDDPARYLKYPGVLLVIPDAPNKDPYENMTITTGGWMDASRLTIKPEYVRSAVYREYDGANGIAVLVAKLLHCFGATLVRDCDSFLLMEPRRMMDETHLYLLKPNKVNQVFVSAIDQGASNLLMSKKFSEMQSVMNQACLMAAYLNTLLAALECHSPAVVLTVVGGGVFDNSFDVIVDALFKAMHCFEIYRQNAGHPDIPIYLNLYDASAPVKTLSGLRPTLCLDYLKEALELNWMPDLSWVTIKS
jgi:hypothetical protein